MPEDHTAYACKHGEQKAYTLGVLGVTL